MIIKVPVTIGFDTWQIIGYMEIDETKLPPSCGYVFSLGIRTLDNVDAPGSIPTGPYLGKYELIEVGLVTDENYIQYLKQIGKI